MKVVITHEPSIERWLIMLIDSDEGTGSCVVGAMSEGKDGKLDHYVNAKDNPKPKLIAAEL